MVWISGSESVNPAQPTARHLAGFLRINRMQQAGLEQWIAERDGRAATGFTCADVRFPQGTAE